ncbi:MAG: tRNA (guanosine(46)-N7)-methyltransferase TrmB [Ruminococcaceae bacterium]|nr:tRNA (guanosine(46)-N7)-methyltransferase TrmB [Oscillospiraceae bacterium]
MRMRKKKHGAERIAACADLLFTDRAEIENFLKDKGSACQLEIGCGKGDFAIEASQRTDIPFIAIERSSDVAVVAMEKAKAAGCDNLHFVVGNAELLLPNLFQKGEVDTLYLNFSDPWPKKGYAKRRLTHRNFLALYRELLSDDGKIVFKTDNAGLFDFSLEEFAAAGFRMEEICRDLHNSEYNEGNIQTEYERNFSAKGFPIHRVVAYMH